MALPENILDGLGRAGPLGRSLAPRLDLLRSIGAGYAVREQRRRHTARTSVSDGRRAGYVERWSDAVRQLGGEARDLGAGFVELSLDGRHVLVWNHWVAFDDIITLKLALDKPLCHQVLSAHGLPVPEHAFFDVEDLATAQSFMAGGGAYVVKPSDLQGGTVTTSGITTEGQLRRARLRARRITRRMLIERQVAGDNYRLLFLDGRLLDAVRRHPPVLRGDGRSSVRDLLAAENLRRYEANGGARTWELVADLDTVFTLQHQGLTLGSTPAAGRPVTVRTVVNANGPEFNESVRDEISEALVADGAQAARLLRVRLAGVDVITPDCTRSLHEAGGVVLEVNATPGLHYHYDTRNQERGVPVMIPILRALFAEARQGSGPLALDVPATSEGARTHRS